MALTQVQARELANLLSDDLSCENARERLLCVAEVLRTLSDSEHPLSNADIRAVLRARFGEGCAPSENTVAADIRALRNSACLGITVHTSPSGAWCENRTLSPGKVRMLLNTVQSSRFLTAAQNADLQESLLSLVSRHQEESLEGQVLVNQRVRKSYQQVFDACDTIAQAIRMNLKVEFIYTYNDFEGRPIALMSDAGEILRVETPIALLFSEGNYYLESYSDVPWRHGEQIMRSRVDRMYETRLSTEPADSNETVRRARRDAERRLDESVEMVDGKTRIIFLRVRADYTNVMFDRFGYGLKYGHYHGNIGEVTTTAITCVEVAQSFTFFRWLSSAGDGIVMVRPPSAMALLSGPWKDMLQGIPYDRVAEDHRAMVSGYLEFLDRARKPYEQKA